MKYQVTLFDKSGKYKPVSCIIEAEDININSQADRKILLSRGTTKICQKRLWTKREILKYNYLVGKVRVYEQK